MMKNNIRKHIKFNQVHEDIVNEMIDTIPGINSFSEAVRYAVLSFDGQTERQKEHNAMKRKQNAMSKNIDILLEIVSSGFHEQKVAMVKKKEDTFVYQDALKIVEDNIQRSITARSYKQPQRKTKSQTNGQLQQHKSIAQRSIDSNLPTYNPNDY